MQNYLGRMRATDPTWIWRLTMVAAIPLMIIPIANLLAMRPAVDPRIVIASTFGELLIFARLYIGDNRVFQGELRMHARNRVHVADSVLSGVLLIGQPLALHLMARTVDHPATFLLSQSVLLAFNVAWLGLRIIRSFAFIRVHQGQEEYAEDIRICLNMGQAMGVWILNNSIFLLLVASAFVALGTDATVTNFLLIGSILSSIVDLGLTRRIYLGHVVC